MTPRRFFWRLYLAWMAVLVAALAAVAVAAAGRTQAVQMEGRKDALARESRLAYGLLRDDLLNGRMENVRRETARLAAVAGARITVVDSEGRVLADSAADPAQMDNHRLRPEIVAAAAHGVGVAFRDSHTVGEDMLYLATRHDEAGGRTTYLRLATSASRLRQDLRGFDAGLAVVLALILLAGGGAGWWTARRLARPLPELSLLARRLAAGERGGRVHVEQPGEPGEIAAALNQLGESLEAAQRRTAAEHEELRAVLDSMSDGVLATDPRQQVLLVNTAAAGLLGFGAASAAGKPLWTLVSQEALLKAAAGVLVTGEKTVLRWTCARGRHLEAVVAPLQRQTPPAGLLVVVRDVSKDVQYQELRQEFVANVSHELRTPLTVIRGYVETLQSGGLKDDAETREQLATLARRVQQLANLVEDLLELSRLESPAGLPGMAAVNLSARIASVVELMQPAAQAKSQTLTVDVPDGLPLVVGQADYLERAIANLVDNAIKYTPEGGTVRVSATVAPAAPAAPLAVVAGGAPAATTPGHVIIAVTDNGIGIPEKDLPRLFERFYRVDKSRSRALGGTGLGLAIVKHIAQAHGGSVEVRSQLGAGSTFRLTLPIQPGR